MATIFGHISVETPKYNVLAQRTGYEIRKYVPQLWAEHTFEVEPDTGVFQNVGDPFRALAGFIFGKNTKPDATTSESISMTAPVVVQQQPSSESIAMTAPVVIQRDSAGTGTSASTRKMAFILPSKYTDAAQVPTPNDSSVKIVEHPEYIAAVIRFSGSTSQSNMESKEHELRSLCEKEGVNLSSDKSQVQYRGYNPPWCLPFLKTNEVAIPVVGDEKQFVQPSG